MQNSRILASVDFRTRGRSIMKIWQSEEGWTFFWALTSLSKSEFSAGGKELSVSWPDMFLQ